MESGSGSPPDPDAAPAPAEKPAPRRRRARSKTAPAALAKPDAQPGDVVPEVAVAAKRPRKKRAPKADAQPAARKPRANSRKPKVAVDSPRAEEAPTPTATATPTPNPNPISTPNPTPNPNPISTPNPTPNPNPISTPNPTPTSTPNPSSTATPSAAAPARPLSPAIVRNPRPPRPPRRPIGLYLASALVVAAVAVTLVPWFLLTRAERRANQCFSDIVRAAAGDPQGCLPPRRDLALARRMPWLRDDARRVDEMLAFRAARLRYDQATAIAPDAHERDDAARKLLELSYHGSASDHAAALAAVASSFNVVIELALDSRDPEALAFALKSARALGDIERMKQLAQAGSGEEAFGIGLRRGALLCLLGDRDAGAAAFAAVDHSHRLEADNAEGLGLARLGLVACERPTIGEIDAHDVPDRYRPALSALEASADPRAAELARAVLDDPKHQIGGEQRLRLAPYLIRALHPSALEALRILAPPHTPAARVDLVTLRTPWTVLDVDVPVQAVFIDTKSAEEAAAHLEKLARELGDKPLDCSGDECPDPAALKMPAAILDEAARLSWLDDAAEHVRLGHRKEALAAVDHARRLTVPTRRYLLAPLHLAVGDAAGALAVTEDTIEKMDSYRPTAQARIYLNRSLAFAHLGKLDKAMAAAAQAYVAAEHAEKNREEDSDDSDAVLHDDTIAAAWLWGATAVAAGKTDRVQHLLDTATTRDLSEIAAWVSLAGRAEEQRRADRWELTIAKASGPALPAVMYLAARAVPPSADVEVWLDRIFHDEHRSQPLRAMRARAEAARWRGDVKAADLWSDRAEKMLALIHDYRSALLAHILDLK